MDRFLRACLVLIVLLLGVIAFRPILTPQAVEAAHHYKFTVATLPFGIPANTPELPYKVQSVIDKYTADGWEYVGQVSVQRDGPVLIFRK